MAAPWEQRRAYVQHDDGTIDTTPDSFAAPGPPFEDVYVAHADAP